MRNFQLFLISIVPTQLWGIVVYFALEGNPGSLRALIDAFILLSYIAFVNLLEAAALTLLVILLTFLLPKRLKKNQVILIQLLLITILTFAAIAAHFLPEFTHLFGQSKLLAYIAVNLINTKLYRWAALILTGIVLDILLAWLLLGIIRSERPFAWAVEVKDRILALGWFYVVIDAFFFLVFILRATHVI